MGNSITPGREHWKIDRHFTCFMLHERRWLDVFLLFCYALSLLCTDGSKKNHSLNVFHCHYERGEDCLGRNIQSGY